MNLYPHPKDWTRTGTGHAPEPGPAQVHAEAGVEERVLARAQSRLRKSGVCLSLRQDGDLAEGAYVLSVQSDGAILRARSAAGHFSGLATIFQLMDSGSLPGGHIEDAPDFPVRGVMLDISRDRVPRMGPLLERVDRLADLKINQLQLYVEHTFAYPGHEAVWKDASPFTPAELRWLDDHCHARGIELVGNQQSFGHWHRWLTRDGYTDLAEHPAGIEHAFAVEPEPFGLDLANPKSLDLLSELLEEQASCLRSKRFNVGLDETLDLGLGHSKSAVEARGPGPVYLEGVKRIHERVSRLGLSMQFWGDMILGYPEQVAELPGDATALAWGYEAGHPFEENAALFAKSGLEFYVCPGTSSWQSMIGRTPNAAKNLVEAARAGRNHGATGLLVTDWGDFGHWQPPSISAPGLVLAAGLGWNADLELERSDWSAAIDRFLPAAAPGSALLELGEVAEGSGIAAVNGAPWFYPLRYAHKTFPPPYLAGDATADRFEAAREVIEGITLPDGEVRTAARLAALACRFSAAWAKSGEAAPLSRVSIGAAAELHSQLEELQSEYASSWLAVSRAGGLQDSWGRLDAAWARLS